MRSQVGLGRDTYDEKNCPWNIYTIYVDDIYV